MKNIFLNFKKRFIDFSIYTKLIVSFLTIVLFLVIISFVDFFYYKNDKTKNTLNTISQMNNQGLTEIDSYIKDIEKLTQLPLFYKNSNILYNLKESNLDPNKINDMETDTNYIFNNIFALKNEIHSVFLFNLNGKSLYKIPGSSLYTPYYPSNERWFQESIQNFGKPVLTPMYKIDYIADKQLGSSYLFNISRALIDYDMGKVEGVISINSTVDVLKNFLQKLLIYDKQRILLIDHNNNIIYDTIEGNIGKPLKSTSINLTDDEIKKGSINIDNTNYIIKTNKSSYCNWTIVNLIPTQSLNKQITNLKNYSISITILFILLSLVFIALLSKQIVRPIQLLTKKIKLVENGDLDVHLTLTSNDEIGKLSRSFDSMIIKLRELINEVYVDKIKQKELEMNMLQNQINPHFLYNTLESIHMMAEINDDAEVSEMSTALGSILRYGLNTRIKLVSLEDEINNITLYMELQKIRLDNIEDLIIDVDKDLLKTKVLKLILQPIVENSIYHGLSSIAEGGIISIKIYILDTNLIIDVVDNGQGMDKDTLDKLTGYINGFNDSFKSIGLRNVNLRLKLHYGNSYGLEIFSSLEQGTLVKIKIPLL